MFPILTIGELFSFIRRRWLLVAVFAVLGMVAGVLLALRSERVYETAAVIQIVAPVITRDDAASVAATITRRIQTIEQQLTSRDTMLQLADQHAMFEGLPLTMAERADLMRQSIRFIVMNATSGSPFDPPSSIVVFANAGTAEQAAAVANDLANRFVRETTSSRQSEAESNLAFFTQEVERLEREIITLEGELARFQSENLDLLPSSLTPRREEARRLDEVRLTIQREIVQAQTELAGLDETSTRAVTQRQIEELRELIAGRERELQLLQARSQQLADLFQRAPEVARELTILERGLTQLQSQLTIAQASRRDAELGQRIGEDDQAERFLVFEQALPPEAPVSRSRRVIVMAVTFAGAMAGAALALGLEFARPVLRTAARMERELQLRPVVSIPYTVPAGLRRSRSRRTGAMLAGGLGLAILMLLLVLGR